MRSYACAWLPDDNFGESFLNFCFAKAGSLLISARQTTKFKAVVLSLPPSHDRSSGITEDMLPQLAAS